MPNQTIDSQVHAYENVMYSSSLLAHLSKSFAPHPESIATEALGHILMNSPAATDAMASMFTTMGISARLRERTRLVRT